MKKCVFINPVLVIQKGDFLGSGIPYMPHIMAYTVGLVKRKHKIKVIDAFGQDPFRLRQKKSFYWQGIGIREILCQIETDTDVVFLYSSAITNVDFNIALIRRIKKKFSRLRVVVLANTQAVTSFNINVVASKFFRAGVEGIVYNNIERTALDLIDEGFNYQKVGNCIFMENGKIRTSEMSLEIGETDELVLPAWDDFPLNNYWRLGYGHGPSQGRYLPILTSYGCPFRCEFCVNPSINKSRWQGKKPKNVFSEIKYMVEKIGVDEFHLEDLNPTVDKNRILRLCELIIKGGLKVKLKIVSGTKVETLDGRVLREMKKAGFSYVSISPETGSKEVLKLMKKPFDYVHADKIIGLCKRYGVKTQACFVLGFPGETEDDINITRRYIRHITRKGIDEIAVFIATPLPGTGLYERLKGYKKLSGLTFSPAWRDDYKDLEKYRSLMYFDFLITKFMCYPFRMLGQFVNFLSRNFETKMEMIPYRVLRFRMLQTKNG